MESVCPGSESYEVQFNLVHEKVRRKRCIRVPLASYSARRLTRILSRRLSSIALTNIPASRASSSPSVTSATCGSRGSTILAPSRPRVPPTGVAAVTAPSVAYSYAFEDEKVETTAPYLRILTGVDHESSELCLGEHIVSLRSFDGSRRGRLFPRIGQRRL